MRQNTKSRSKSGGNNHSAQKPPSLYQITQDAQDAAENASPARTRKRKRKELREERRRHRQYLAITCILILELALVVIFFAARHFRTEPKSPDITSADSAQNEPSGPIPENPSDEQQRPLPETYSPTPAPTRDPSGAVNLDSGGSPYSVRRMDWTQDISGWVEVGSQYIMLCDAANGEIWAGRNDDALMYPASMTKVLTLLVAAECLSEPEHAWFTITREITNYCYVNNCSVAGFYVDETVTLEDLLYGCILPSGADAALALAEYTYGSQELFVAAMNRKVTELGLDPVRDAHFVNCIGLYDPEHYCTPRAMAIIMMAAMNNPLCRDVMTAHRWTTTHTEAHPYGIALSNLFLRRIEDRFPDSDLDVLAAKTGYVKESGNCAVSLARRASDGREFICVTGNAPGSWAAIADHTIIYQTFCEPSKKDIPKEIPEEIPQAQAILPETETVPADASDTPG